MMDAATLDLIRLAAEGGVVLMLSIAVWKLWKAYRDESEAHKTTLRELLRVQTANMNSRVMLVEDRMIALEGIAAGKSLSETFRRNPVKSLIDGPELDPDE